MQWKIVDESHNSLTHIFREFQRIIIVLDLAQVEPRIKWQLASWRNHAKKKARIRRIVVTRREKVGMPPNFTDRRH